ncbi:lytic transglycosylase domain-containing protein [Methylocapsa sp. S129]|uniref:lytic transglycosylase domain-containing protein n=1 Tax=Methylocapsa sp. S129 TaxID=1641869 RepID=UPI00131DC4A3|nr:lytic transglycosylase domain-containing protein [Methylocapsa sp. S129]
MLKRSIPAAFALLFLLCARAVASGRDDMGGGMESLADSVCRLIETSARAQSLPVAFLTRLIWRESGFQASVVSPAGAQGIAQFMPGTASDRGLANPFDPEEAIPKAAELLAELRLRFGNLGLAAAAYNAGPTRVANWLAGGFLPAETRDYILAITRHPVEDWTDVAIVAKLTDDAVFPEQSCLKETAAVRAPQADEIAAAPLLAPWGVQISGSFSKAAAVAAYMRVRGRYAAILGDVEPMVIGGRMRSRGFGRFYGVRAPAATRAAADALCAKILRAGGACVVLRS